jgi:hypothetical protein
MLFIGGHCIVLQDFHPQPDAFWGKGTRKQQWMRALSFLKRERMRALIGGRSVFSAERQGSFGGTIEA